MPLPIFSQPWRQAGSGLGAYQAPTVPIFAPPPTPYTPWAPGAPGGGGMVAPGVGGGASNGGGGDDTNTNPQTGSENSYQSYDDFKAQLPKWAQDILASAGGAMKYTPAGMLTGAVNAGATALGKIPAIAGLAPIKSVPTTTWDASGSGYDTGVDQDYANVERIAKGQPAPDPLAAPDNPYHVQNGYIEGMAGQGANTAPLSPFEQFLQGAQGLRQWQGNPATTPGNAVSVGGIPTGATPSAGTSGFLTNMLRDMTSPAALGGIGGGLLGGSVGGFPGALIGGQLGAHLLPPSWGSNQNDAIQNDPVFTAYQQGLQAGSRGPSWPVPEVTRSVLDTFDNAAGNEDWRNAAGQEDTSGYTFNDGWWKDDNSDTYYQ